MHLRDAARASLDALAEQGLLRRLRLVEGVGPLARTNGREVVHLCSNNYLGLAADSPLLRHLEHRATSAQHAGAAASRLVSGSSPAHAACERELAAFVHAEAALLFATGYAANVGTIPALVGAGDLVFSDALNHASLIDGCRLSRADVHVYPHLDIDALQAALERRRADARVAMVVTESVFSMDGDKAPLEELRAVCDRYDAALMVDEAHSLGVFGPEGKGLCAASNVRPDILIGPLGKAFGLTGAFVAGAAPIIQLLENRARSFVFSTAPPPLIASLVLDALGLVRAADDRRTRLHANAKVLREGLGRVGYTVRSEDSPILAVDVGEPHAALALSEALLEGGVFVQAIRPPTVPRGTSRLRVVPIATHTDAHLDQALQAFAAVRSRGP